MRAALIVIRFLRLLLRQPDERAARLESLLAQREDHVRMLRLLAQREDHVRMLRRDIAEVTIALMAEHQHRLRAEALLEQREEMRQ